MSMQTQSCDPDRIAAFLDRQLSEAEQRILELLDENEVELAVLAKYMQVLSSDFLERFPQVINIHHSFLPAFKGAQPYHRAWDRGVKLIGATAHYVTEDLDDGPIIEQTTVAVSHRDEVEDLIRKGRDTERLALARALLASPDFVLFFLAVTERSKAARARDFRRMNKRVFAAIIRSEKAVTFVCAEQLYDTCSHPVFFLVKLTAVFCLLQNSLKPTHTRTGKF